MQVRRGVHTHIHSTACRCNQLTHAHTLRREGRSRCSAGILANVLDSARETLVLLGIVVLKTDLEFNGFQEATLLLQRALQQSADALKERVTGNFRSVISDKFANIINCRCFELRIICMNVAKMVVTCVNSHILVATCLSYFRNHFQTDVVINGPKSWFLIAEHKAF